MHSDWLVNSYTIDEATEYIVEQLAPYNIIMSKGMKKWNEFTEHVEEGDELWYFHSGESSFRRLCGRSGFSIVRNGEIIKSFPLFVS